MATDIQKELFGLFGIEGAPYTKFPRIKRKKNGKKKVRWIHAPEDHLKRQQRTILRSVLYQYASHPCAHAYVAQKNIRSGAFQHKDKQYTIVLDLKDFFPSITKDMVRTALSFYTEDLDEKQTEQFYAWSNKAEEVVKEASITNELPGGITTLDILLEMCTYEGVLPQGAPTSGALSNIVMYPLDCLFEQISNQHDLAYSRYADDLTFSGNDLEQLKRIVFGYVFKKIEENGFTVNKKKVHVFQGDQRIITGLNVHEEGVRPARKYRRKLRARLANIRNKITGVKDLGDLYMELSKARFLRSELGHYWYILYTDTYSQVEKIAADYFIPIAEKIKEFFPDFAGSNKIALSIQLKKANTRNPNFVSAMRHMSVEIRKMMVTEWKLDKPLYKGSYLEKVIKLEHITHREKRELISLALQHDTDRMFFGLLNEKIFQNIYRLASPEDKLDYLLTAIRSCTLYRGIWYKICLYGARHPYHERLVILRTIAESKILTASSSERFILQKAVRKIMRGLNISELGEFVTCDHENIRVAAQDLINHKSARQGLPENDG